MLLKERTALAEDSGQATGWATDQMGFGKLLERCANLVRIRLGGYRARHDALIIVRRDNVQDGGDLLHQGTLAEAREEGGLEGYHEKVEFRFIVG